MNKVILIGRLTRDTDVKVSSTGTTVARFTLAVDRRFRRNNEEQTADFINCVSFGKTAEFMERFGHKGVKFVVEGRIQTGSYTNKDGQRVYTTDVVVEQVEFAESKASSQNFNNQTQPSAAPTDFMQIDEINDEELPFA